MPVGRSKKVRINGIEEELFYISELANELGRTVQTVRKWEIAGTIPSSIFKDNMGRRMYTREQINVIVKVAEQCHLAQGCNTITFSKRVHKLLAELNKKYRGDKDEKNGN